MASKRVFARMNEKRKFSTRHRNRCQITGRARGVYFVVEPDRPHLPPSGMAS